MYWPCEKHSLTTSHNNRDTNVVQFDSVMPNKPFHAWRASPNLDTAEWGTFTVGGGMPNRKAMASITLLISRLGGVEWMKC
jgi:hypothetical protein